MGGLMDFNKIASRIAAREVNIQYDLDFDWDEELSSARQSGTVSISLGPTDEEIIDYLESDEGDSILNNLSSDPNGYVSLVPQTINGQSADISGNDYLSFTSRAIINYLQSNPGVREFKVTGLIE